VAHEADKAGHIRNNHTFRSINDGENKKNNQELQNTHKKAKRAQVTALRKSGDHAGLIQAAYHTPRYVNKQQTAVARGMDPALDFVSILANGNIHLLAAAATDASLNVTEGVVNFTCKDAATRAMAELMIDYKRVNKLVQQYTAIYAYDLDAAPNLSVQVHFRNRAYKKSIVDSFVNVFPADDSDTVDLVEDIADDLDDLRKQVQDWYGDTYNYGVNERKMALQTPYPAKRIVISMVKKTIQDGTLRDHLLSILEDPTPDADNELRIQSLLNGSFFMRTQSTTAFHFIPQLLEFGFPSSGSNACCFNQDMWSKLIRSAVQQGHQRRDVLAKFLLVGAAMDGSILSNRFEVIVPDNVSMIAFFRRIFEELHEGVPFPNPLNVYHAKSPIKNGKDITHL
jgi:hypothetical protein